MVSSGLLLRAFRHFRSRPPGSPRPGVPRARPARAMAAARLAPAARALVVLSLLASSSAWLGSTLAVTGSGSADRSPVLVFAPNTRSDAKLPLLLLLHGRCDNALGADASFRFANLVDQARAPARSSARSAARGTAARRVCEATRSRQLHRIALGCPTHCARFDDSPPSCWRCRRPPAATRAPPAAPACWARAPAARGPPRRRAARTCRPLTTRHIS